MLKCHYCGYETRAVSTCPSCGSPYIGGFKAGTQKIEEIVAKQFPMAKILRMDYDTTRSKDSYEQILSAFANEEADILIGTQMIVKGHDFPGVTLVGILAADLSLGVSDYRAAERTFQLLTQAAGRAGRGRLPGEVIIQTYQPDHFAIQTAKNQDYEAFYAQEIAYRKLMCYPPVWNLLLLAITSPKEEEAISASIAVAGWFQEQRPGLRVIGPSDAILAKKNDIYRRAVYLKTEKYQDLVEAKEAFERYMHEHPLQEKQVSIYYDFNPMNGF